MGKTHLRNGKRKGTIAFQPEQEKMEPEKELRSRPRLKLQKLMFAEYAGERVSVHDLSMSGAFVASKVPLPPGETIQLKVWLGTQEMVETEAVVRHTVEGRGLGVEFLNLSDEARARLQRFLSTDRHGGRPD